MTPGWVGTRTERGLAWSSVVFLLGVVILAGLFAYDYLFVRVYLVPVWEWDVTRSDWLFGLSMLVLWYLGAHSLGGRGTAVRRRLASHPWTVVGLVWLGLFFLLGTVAFGLLAQPKIDFIHAYQPPVFASVPADRVTECVGRVAEGRCHGDWRHPLGTDAWGIDVLWMVVAGAHVAVYVAVIAAALIVPIGVSVGAVAGYYGGAIDTGLMRYVDVQQTVPAVVVYILLILVLEKTLFAFVVIFGLFSWGGVARIVRSEVRTRRDAEYVIAARNAGGTESYALRRHILPNVSHAVVTLLAQQIPVLLVTEAAIAYLRLGDADAFSWGRLITRGLPTTEASLAAQWWVSGAGVVALSVTVVCFKLLGDSARDLLDPGGE